MGVMKPIDVTAFLRCKVAVVGAESAGKTALVSMYTSKNTKFPKTYNMTTNVEVVIAKVVVPETTVQVELYIYDTAGNDIFKESAPQYWNNIYYAMLVYDVTNYDSFQAAQSWFEELKKARQEKDRPLKAVLVATKSDQPAQRHAVPSDVGANWANQQGLPFFEVSAALPGKDVELPFISLAKTFHDAYEEKVKGFEDACRNY